MNRPPLKNGTARRPGVARAHEAEQLAGALHDVALARGVERSVVKYSCGNSPMSSANIVRMHWSVNCTISRSRWMLVLRFR